jgi:hypothetical protein
MKPSFLSSLNLREAILVTLLYSGLFSYPLKYQEVWFWLPKKASLTAVKEALDQLVKEGKIRHKNSFYFLGHSQIIARRREREKISKKKLIRAKKVGSKLVSLPWVGLVSVSGNLALRAAGEEDDIDLVIITLPGALFRGRLMSILLVEILGCRRRPKEKKVADKMCLNLFLEVDNLSLPKTREDFYTAHEALQLLPVAGDNSFYRQFLLDNGWLANYLPQAYQEQLKKTGPADASKIIKKESKANWLEQIALAGQLAYAKIHQRRLAKEKSRQLFFHPQDQRQIVLARLKKCWQKLNSS